MNPVCTHGHEIVGDNVVIRRGKPTCRTCEHTHAARTRAKRLAARLAESPSGETAGDVE